MLQQSETQRFHNIINSRITVEFAQCNGVPTTMRISNDPFQGYWNEKLEASVDIYSTNANKAPILDSEWFNAEYEKALALDAAGESDAAREIFDDLLNKAQLTFSLVNREAAPSKFAKGEVIKAVLVKVKVERKDADGKGTGEFYDSIAVDGTPIAAQAQQAAKRVFGSKAPATA
jgi:hypothetical protein